MLAGLACYKSRPSTDTGANRAGKTADDYFDPLAIVAVTGKSYACVLIVSLWLDWIKAIDNDANESNSAVIWIMTELLLSIQTGFSFVNAAVVCAIPESVSCLEPSSV